jgi:hypothetical protein
VDAPVYNPPPGSANSNGRNPPFSLPLFLKFYLIITLLTDYGNVIYPAPGSHIILTLFWISPVMTSTTSSQGRMPCHDVNIIIHNMSSTYKKATMNMSSPLTKCHHHLQHHKPILAGTTAWFLGVGLLPGPSIQNLRGSPQDTGIGRTLSNRYISATGGVATGAASRARNRRGDEAGSWNLNYWIQLIASGVAIVLYCYLYCVQIIRVIEVYPDCISYSS